MSLWTSAVGRLVAWWRSIRGTEEEEGLLALAGVLGLAFATLLAVISEIMVGRYAAKQEEKARAAQEALEEASNTENEGEEGVPDEGEDAIEDEPARDEKQAGRVPNQTTKRSSMPKTGPNHQTTQEMKNN